MLAILLQRFFPLYLFFLLFRLAQNLNKISSRAANIDIFGPACKCSLSFFLARGLKFVAPSGCLGSFSLGELFFLYFAIVEHVFDQILALLERTDLEFFVLKPVLQIVRFLLLIVDFFCLLMDLVLVFGKKRFLLQLLFSFLFLVLF